MQFTEKISGTKVTDFNIAPIFKSQYISLQDLLDADLNQKAMDFILDTFRFRKGERTEYNQNECLWWTTIDWDSILKVSILQNYPQYEAEFVEYFGEEWLKHYIRFNH